MYNVVDPTDSRWAYNTRELNQLGRMDQQTGIRKDIRPPAPPGVRLRYNWIAPIALSPFDSKVLYAGAQMLFRSKDRGDTWEAISPDLTTNDTTKIGFPSTPYCTISSLAESPAKAGVIWVGTDDGKIQLTTDNGAHWTDLTSALESAGAPRDRWVSRVFPSPLDANVAFVSKNGFRNDDFTPYLYRTTDGGKSWTSIAGDLPKAPINVVVQDRVNSHLLIIGNDIGVYVSINDGAHWTRWKADLPTVAVHDLLIHPRENDLVIATYGRALWTGSMLPLRELSAETLAQPVHLFDIKTATRYDFGTQGMNYALGGDKYLRVPNEPEGIVVNYSLGADGTAARIVVTDSAGAVARTVNGPAKRGLNRVVIPIQAFGGRGRGGRGGAGGSESGAVLTPGKYTVTLEVGGQHLTKTAVVRNSARLGDQKSHPERSEGSLSLR